MLTPRAVTVVPAMQWAQGPTGGVHSGTRCRRSQRPLIHHCAYVEGGLGRIWPAYTHAAAAFLGSQMCATVTKHHVRVAVANRRSSSSTVPEGDMLYCIRGPSWKASTTVLFYASWPRMSCWDSERYGDQGGAGRMAFMKHEIDA